MKKESQLAMEPMPRLLRGVRSDSLFARERGPIVLARAPGRLDVMGGVADYSGSLVCEMPLAIAAGAAVQRRSDARVVCRSRQESGEVSVPAALLAAKDPLEVRRALEGSAAWARYLIGCAWWLAQQGTPVGGLSIQVDSDVPLGGGVSSSAAIEVATMSALGALLGVRPEPLELAVACQAVENRVVGAPCGVMDQVTSAMGQTDNMLEIVCQAPVAGKGGGGALPAQVLGQVKVPAGYAFVGVHSGVRHEVSGDPYTDTRVAAFMGQKILSTLGDPDPTRGHLACLDADHYESHFRGSLPQAMTGQDFLKQYRATHDPVTTVRPEKTYGVRAAVDHGVFEMLRVTRFVNLLKRAAADRAEAPEAMRQAGELMYESHRSYSDCARLGHAMTDALVAAVRGETGAGLLGAKITGGGCGGTVAILIRDEARARDAITAIRDRYTAQSRRATMLFEGSGPGAAAWGSVSLTAGEIA